MKLPEKLAAAFDRLRTHYVRLEEEDGAARQSGEGPFEAQMGQLQKSSRHKPMLMLLASGRLGYLRGTDLACGCDVHCYHPTQQGARDYDGPDVQLDGRPDPMATALRSLGEKDDPVRVQLARLARVPLPKHLYIFGAPFKGEEDHRALQRAPLIGVAREVEHGPGTIAHLSDIARSRWGLRARDDVEQLGQRIAARKGEAADRELARAIRVETEAMARKALTALDGALHPYAALVARANERRAVA